MDTLFEVIMYPLQRLAALLFSVQIADGISVGALVVSAMILIIIFRGFIGIHLSVFNNTEGSVTRSANRGRKHSGRNSGGGAE